MKKKGILLLGSLALMVVAMVFIAVTLVSRSSVTPTTSDAATLKKKLDFSSTSSSSDNKYYFTKYDLNAGEQAYPGNINENGYIVGTTYTVLNDANYSNRITIWDPNGKADIITDSNFKEVWPAGINDSNVIAGTNIDTTTWKGSAFKYSKTGGYEQLNPLPLTKSKKLLTKPGLNQKVNIGRTRVNELVKKPYGRNDLIDGSSESWSINNSGDVVGSSNNLGVLWVSGQKNPVDLSVLFTSTNGYISNSYCVNVANRINVVIKVLCKAFEVTKDGNYYENLYIIDYDSQKKLVIATKKTTNTSDGKLVGTFPVKVLSDESVITNVFLETEKGLWYSDGYNFSPKGDYVGNTSLNGFIKGLGIPATDSGYNGINNKLQGVGWYHLNNSYNYVNFIADFKNRKLDLVQDLIRDGKIIGYVPGLNIVPVGINESGTIVLQITDNTGFIPYVGKLVPAK